MIPADWELTTWGKVVDLRYGKALRGYRDGSGSIAVYGTNGPVGVTGVPQAKGPGVVVGRKGAYRGVHFAPQDYWVIDTAYYIDPKRPLHMRWAYYSLQLADINGLDSGSAIPSTTRESFAGLRACIPPLGEQQAIAEVLGALDDKIASNAKLAAVAIDLVHSEYLRLTPLAVRGDTTFADVARVSGGGTPSTKISGYWGGDVRWATPTDMTALDGPYLSSTSRTITQDGLAACSSALFDSGAILMTSRATIGALAVNTVPTATNQGFIVVEPHDSRMRWWLFHQMQSRVSEFISWANGATFLELSRGTFKSLAVTSLPAEALAGFDTMAEATHSLARSTLAENRSLAATRDALLPRLMSGQLRVRDAEAAASAAGA